MEDNVFSDIAKSLSMDMDSFEECLSEKGGRTRVRDNILEANALQIKGVPFVYVNSQEIMGEINIEDLERIIDIELGGKENGQED